MTTNHGTLCCSIKSGTLEIAISLYLKHCYNCHIYSCCCIFARSTLLSTGHRLIISWRSCCCLVKWLHTYTVKLTIAWNAGVKRPAENAPPITQAMTVVQNTLKCGAYQGHINNEPATYDWVELERILTLTVSHLDRSEGRMELARWKDTRHQKKMLMLSSRSTHNPTTETYLYASVQYITTASALLRFI